MNAKDLRYVRDTIENEGFHYAFVNYSDFEQVKDRKFHSLRRAYEKAAKALAEYIREDE